MNVAASRHAAAAMPCHVAILGAGPAGLSAADALLRAGIRVSVLDRTATPGGLGGTTRFEGRAGTYRFDFGGHRFITANRDLMRLVDDLLGDDLLVAERHSVIRNGGRVYDYPLSPGNLIRQAPPALLMRAMVDFASGRTGRAPQGEDFASWTRARFGPTLYETFFAGYTRKLWGITPERLSGDWAEQRISLDGLGDVVRRLLPGAGGTPRSYSRSYRYPRHGFGQLFERLAARTLREGGTIRGGVTVTGLVRAGNRIRAVETDQGPIACDAVISTLPLPLMQEMTGGGPSQLRFRGLRFLNFPVSGGDVSPWTWQYLSDPGILATRLQEPRRRSPEMAPPGMSSLMMEIPCDPGDTLWELPDDALFERIKPDLEHLGIDPARATGEMFSTRAAHAYPLMEMGYRAHRARACAHLDRLENLVQAGRQATFRYIFTDTAMEMGQKAAAMLIAGEDRRREIYNHRNERTVIEAESIT